MTSPARIAFLILGLLAATGAGWPAAAQEPGRRKGFSIEITAPQNQAIVAGRTRIAARVHIDDQALVDRVEFWVGDERIFVDRQAPYECFHDFGEPTRSWVIRVVAYHEEHVSTGDAVITRRIAFGAVERVNNVLLWISARDKQGRFVEDLTRKDFRIFEGAAEQQVLDFRREDRPITLAILLDSSGSMREKLDEVHGAAGAFVSTLRPEDRALVIDFDDRAYLLEDLTADQERLKAAVVSTEALGGTALYDALHAAYRKIGTIEGRRAIVLLSDGEDSASQIGFKRLLEEAKSNNTMIFAVGLGGEGPGVRRDVLRELSEVTGGRAFFVKSAKDLAETYERIAEELRTQYFLSYSTANEQWDGRWIELRVEPTRPDLDVRSRKGYFAVRASAKGD